MSLINWGGANKTTLDPIRSSIRKAVTVMAFKEKYGKVNKKYPSASPLCHKFNMDKLDSFPAIAFELYSSMARALGL